MFEGICYMLAPSCVLAHRPFPADLFGGCSLSFAGEEMKAQGG